MNERTKMFSGQKGQKSNTGSRVSLTKRGGVSLPFTPKEIESVSCVVHRYLYFCVP
jgi:hypothetical protein